MLTSYELREAVECRIGRIRNDSEYYKAELEARQKLARINTRAGRCYGEDGYGDLYLINLTVEIFKNNRLKGFINHASDAFISAETELREDKAWV